MLQRQIPGLDLKSSNSESGSYTEYSKEYPGASFLRSPAEGEGKEGFPPPLDDSLVTKSFLGKQ